MTDKEFRVFIGIKYCEHFCNSEISVALECVAPHSKATEISLWCSWICPTVFSLTPRNVSACPVRSGCWEVDTLEAEPRRAEGLSLRCAGLGSVRAVYPISSLTLPCAGGHAQEPVSAGVQCSGFGSGPFTWHLGSVIF